MELDNSSDLTSMEETIIYERKNGAVVTAFIWAFVVCMALFIVSSSIISIYAGLYLISGSNSQHMLTILIIFGTLTVISVSILIIACFAEIVYQLTH